MLITVIRQRVIINYEVTECRRFQVILVQFVDRFLLMCQQESLISLVYAGHDGDSRVEKHPDPDVGLGSLLSLFYFESFEFECLGAHPASLSHAFGDGLVNAWLPCRGIDPFVDDYYFVGV